MDLRKLKTLIDLVSDSDVSELEVTEGESKVRIVKSKPDLNSNQINLEVPGQFVKKNISEIQKNDPGLEEKDNLKEDKDPNVQIIKSPMVGTFYRSSSPDSKPFIEIGSKIEAGEAVCIIEAMKLLNEINSEISGIIKKIFVENGQPVEFGQPLFKVIN